MDTIANRIMLVVEKTCKNKSEFARKVNVTPAYISRLGKHPELVPSDRTIIDICEKFNVREKWLREGKGEMFLELSKDAELASFVDSILIAEKDDFKRRIVSIMAKMNAEQWKMLESLALQLTDEIKKSGSNEPES